MDKSKVIARIKDIKMFSKAKQINKFGVRFYFKDLNDAKKFWGNPQEVSTSNYRVEQHIKNVGDRQFILQSTLKLTSEISEIPDLRPEFEIIMSCDEGLIVAFKNYDGLVKNLSKAGVSETERTAFFKRSVLECPDKIFYGVGFSFMHETKVSVSMVRLKEPNSLDHTYEFIVECDYPNAKELCQYLEKLPNTAKIISLDEKQTEGLNYKDMFDGFQEEHKLVIIEEELPEQKIADKISHMIFYLLDDKCSTDKCFDEVPTWGLDLSDTMELFACMSVLSCPDRIGNICSVIDEKMPAMFLAKEVKRSPNSPAYKLLCILKRFVYPMGI